MIKVKPIHQNLKLGFIVLYLVVFIFPVGIYGKTVGNLGFNNALRTAFSNNKELVALQKKIDKSKIKIETASRLFQENPEVDGAIKNRHTLDKQSLIDFEASVNLPVEIRNQRQYRKEIAEINLKIAECNLQKKKIEITTKLKNIFSELKILKEKAKILNEKLRVEEKLSEYMKSKAKHGEISQVELNIAKLDVSNTKEKLLSLKQKALSKRGELELLINHKIPQDIDFVFDIPNVFNIPDIDHIINYAKKSNPDIKIASLYIEQSSVKTRLTKTESIFPKLTPSIVYSREDKENIFGIGLGMSLPILNRKKGEIHIAQVEKGIFTLQKQNTQHKVITELKKNYESLNIFQEKKEIYDKEILPVVRQNMDDIKILYQKGEIDFTTFEHFMDSLVETKLEYLNFLQNYYHTIFQIELLAGNTIWNIMNKNQMPGGKR